jgi:RimJ/RimL family protein N-acetyltransferase
VRLPFKSADVRVVIEAPRLRLVPLAAADADEMFEVLDDLRLHRYTGGKPLSCAALANRYRRLELAASDDGVEIWGNWIVRLRDGQIAVGVVQATVRAHAADLAWVIGTRWQGRGYAGEAASALADWLRDAGVRRLAAHIHPEHVSSAGVARHAGLIQTSERDTAGEVIWESSPAHRAANQASTSAAFRSGGNTG